MYAILKAFLCRRIQPLRARTGRISKYIGEEDRNQMVRAPMSNDDAISKIREFLDISKEDRDRLYNLGEGFPAFDAVHPPPRVSLYLVVLL